MTNIEKYLGFAIKSGEIIRGQDKIKVAKNKYFVLVLCRSASENLINLAKNVANKKNIKLIMVDDLFAISHIENCKILAVTNSSLAKEILKQTEEYKVIVD